MKEDPFKMLGTPLPTPSRAALTRWRMKGKSDGNVYEGQTLVRPCVGCAPSPFPVRPTTIPTWNAVSAFSLDDEPSPENPGTWSIYTLAFGNPDWMQETLPTIRAWTARHELPFVEWSKLNPDYPAEKFVEVDMVRDFLERDEEWMMYVDADIYVHPRAPHPACAVTEGSGFYIGEDRPGRVSRQWPKWLEGKFDLKIRDGFIYKNAGLWMIDRATAKAFLEHARQPFFEGIQEQHHFNVWAHDMGDAVKTLPQKWNTMGTKFHDPAWLYHIAGNRKMEKIAELRERGFLPSKFSEPNWKLWQEGELEKAIAIPLKLDADPWRGDALKICLRSIEANLGGDWPVQVFGDVCPAWLDPSVFVEAPSYEEALMRGLSCAAHVLWLNDDMAVLKSCEPNDFRTPWHMGELDLKHGMAARNSWIANRTRVALIEHHERGGNPLNYSTHTPYFFERAKAKATLEKVGITRKIAFEQAYFAGEKGLPIGNKKVRIGEPRSSETLIANWTTSQENDDLRAKLFAEFPIPSRWEIK